MKLRKRQQQKRQLFLENLEQRNLLYGVDIGEEFNTFPDVNVIDNETVLVRYEPGIQIQNGVQLTRAINLNLWQVPVDDGMTAEEMIVQLEAEDDVIYAEHNYYSQAAIIPSDPLFSDLWGLHNEGQTGGTDDADIDAPEAWNRSLGNGSTLVAVIDTGVDYNHPDLIDNMWTNPGEIPGNNIDDDNNGYIDDVHGYDFVNNDGDPMDDHNHGTHVAGTIGAIHNMEGVAGVNPNALIVGVKFLNGNGSGSSADAIKSVDYSVAIGATISNNSWGGGGFSQGLFDSIKAAGQNDHIFVAAAGNNSQNIDLDGFYPASYNLDNIISVAATTDTDARASFSNYGLEDVDLGAPGQSILSTFPNNTYGVFSGTSMASPHVAGVASLLWDTYPNLNASEVKQIIMDSADPIPALDTITVTGGRLNADKALAFDPSVIPDVTVLTPNGGELLDTGGNYTITWTAIDDVGVEEIDIELSLDGGATYEILADNIENNGSYDWNLSFDASDEALIKIKATDIDGRVGSDVSDAVFVIDGELQNPKVMVEQPNGGEVLFVGDIFPIQWNATDEDGPVDIDVDYSVDGGTTFTSLATDLFNNGSYQWTIPDTLTTDAVVRVTARDIEGLSKSDVSDDVFRIRKPYRAPVVEVHTPAGGEDWVVGSVQDITWTATDDEPIPHFWLLYRTDRTSNQWINITPNGTENDGVFEWTIPNTPTEAADIYAIARDSDGLFGWQISNGFSISAATPAPEVTVLDPNGGETLKIGNDYDIIWTATDDVGVVDVDLHYSFNDGIDLHPIALNEPNDGVYTWTVLNIPHTPRDVKVYVTARDDDGNFTTDSSDEPFTVILCTENLPPEVTVIDPNGGEVLIGGEVYPIMWTATDDGEITDIRLFASANGGGTYSLIAGQVENDGLYEWNVPEFATTEALIRVTATDDQSESSFDESDEVFTIQTVVNEFPTATLLAPNGGEVWDVGTDHEITWDATDDQLVTRVKLELSIDGGNTIDSVIADNLANDGTHTWTIPDLVGDDNRIRVTAYDTEGLFAQDWSDASFTIDVVNQPPQVLVSSPNGGELFIVGDTHPIIWTATDDVAVRDVSLFLSTDGGTTFPHVIDQFIPNDGFYQWDIPDLPTDEAIVRVIAFDEDGLFNADVSNSNFTIEAVVNEAPTVTLNTPNGGEILDIGEVFDITWVANDDVLVTHVDLDYSVDNGATWTSIATNVVDNGLYAWTVPNEFTNEALVRVTAYDDEGLFSSDTSDDLFIICGNPQADDHAILPDVDEVFADDDDWLGRMVEDYLAETLALR